MTEYLYHYTSCRSCLEILKHNTLLFNKLKNMNDINELYRPVFFDNLNMSSSKMNKEACRFINQFQQISLTLDRKRKGFDIPAMWGHYANKGKGVCIVFDKDKFIKSLKDNKYIIKHGKISYTNKFSPDFFIKQSTRGRIFLTKRRIKELFFRKTTDWAYEQEYRIIAYAPNSINRIVHNLCDSIVAIIMYESPNHQIRGNSYLSKFLYINNNINILHYSSFIKERNLIDKNRKTIWSTTNWKNIKIDV